MESPTLNTILSNCHINNKAERRVVYGPPSLGGLNFCNLSTEQTILQIQ